MAKRLILLLLPFLFCAQAYATHIVGGEFELRHVSENNYKLLFNLYFDLVNGSPGARDQWVNVAIYEKATNRQITIVTLNLRSETVMNYTNVGCTTTDVRTTTMLYEKDILLDPAIYNHPDGYYVVWERCCRNNTITNIVSPEGAGTTFYMEFPAVVKNGNPFRNSSPKLSPPPNDYACVGELFYYNFGSTDADGDELVYDLVTPLNGYSSTGNVVPTPSSAPYPEISWLPGYAKDNQIQGDPAINIDAKSGRLTVKPKHVGLYVFGVRCQEFRNGVKIGEVRRDFQLLVKACRLNTPPIVSAITDGGTTTYEEGKLIKIGPTTSRCIKVFFTDPDPEETLTLTARPVNFDNNYFKFEGAITGKVNTANGQQVLEASLCLDRCFDTKGQTYLLDLIVSDNGDNGCGLPKQDTLRLSLMVEPMPDNPPAISFSTNKRSYTVEAGDVLRFDVLGRDPDGEEVIVSAQGKGFDLTKHAITFDTKTGTGTVTSPFAWQIDCETVKQDAYQIEFKIVSPTCGQNVTRTEVVEIKTKRYDITNNTVLAEQTVCTGQLPAKLTGSLPTGGNAPYFYTWEMSTSGSSSGYTTATGTSTLQSYTPAALTQTTWFRRKVNSGLCSESISEPVKITVNELIQNNAITADQTICLGSVPALLAGTTPTGGSGKYTYLWEYSLDGDTNGFKPAPGVNNTPTYQPAALPQTTWFRRTVLSAPCDALVSAALKVTVIPPVKDNTISGNQLVCHGKTTTPLTGNAPTGGTGAYTYRWEYSTTGANAGFAPAPGNNTAATYTSGPLTQKTWFRRVVISAPCDNISNAVLATVDPLPAPPLARGATVCSNDPATLTASTPVVSYKLEWYNQATGGLLLHTGSSYTTPTLAATTDYFVQTVNSNGCASSERVKVTAVVAPPVADAGLDKTIIQGKYVELRGKGGATYSWAPAAGLSDPKIANPIARPQETTTYTVTITTAEGCTNTDEVTITVLPRIEPTNAISFNGDNVNDTWHIRNIEYYPNCRVQVFTRWGSQIFDSKGYKEPWNGMYNGKPLPMAAYYYIIDLGMDEAPVSGSITLVK